MKSTDLIASLPTLCAASLLLAGCGGTLNQITPSHASYGGSAVVPAEGKASWMAPESRAVSLLYVSEPESGRVDVFSYPKGKPVGALTGLSGPAGECSNGAGDVFVTNSSASNILEYAHGGTDPIATLSDEGYLPDGCSIDPKTGDLAVANKCRLKGTYCFYAGNLAIYKRAKGTPKFYSSPNFFYYYWCAYDSSGNLYTDGIYFSGSEGEEPIFGVLQKGGSAIASLSLAATIGAGSLMWDGRYLAINQPVTGDIDRFSIHGTTGREVSISTLDGVGELEQVWIQGKRLVAADFKDNDVGLWKYPVGGAPTKTITGIHLPIGVTVSLAPR